MIREISIINKELVNDNKGGILSHVSKTISFDDEKMFKIFPELLTNYHVSFSTFRENRKNKEHFIQTSFLLYDYDDGTKSETIHENLIDVSHFIFGSKNHLKDKEDGKGIVERFHVIIPISEPITNIDLYKYIWKDMESCKLKIKCDKSSKDVTRYYFKHSMMLYGHCSEIMDVTHLYEPYEIFHKQLLAAEKIQFEGGGKTFDSRHKNYKLLYELNSGKRNTNCCILVGSMIRCGMSKYHIKKLIEEHIRYDKSFAQEKLDRIINDFFAKKR